MNQHHIRQVREFNRFYTGVIGLLDKSILGSPFSLPEARLLYELYHHQPCTATEVKSATGMDKGYMSRMISQFKKKGLLTKATSKSDSRASTLSLTARGNKEFEHINHRSAEQIHKMLDALPEAAQEKLLNHMTAIQTILNK